MLRRRRQTRRRKPQAMPFLEALERRELLSAVALDEGVVTVTGTDADDVIAARQSGTNLEILVNGESSFLPLADLTELRVKGLGGNDVITNSAPLRLVAFGGSGDDTIAGGALNDRLLGGDGDDRLNGKAGDDLAKGGAGDDWLKGGPGADSLTGGSGADRITGGSDNDVLRGGRGADSIDGGRGDDTLKGGSGPDSLAGNDGNDFLHGGGGADLLVGGEHDDVLRGGGGHDELHGERGTDHLAGGGGNDRFHVSEGYDTYGGGSGRNAYAPGDASIEFNAYGLDETSDPAVIGKVTARTPAGGQMRFTTSDDRFEVVDGLLRLRPEASLTERSESVRLTLSATDSAKISVRDTFEIAVRPTAGITTNEDQPVRFKLPSAGESLSPTIDVAPENGTLQIHDDGTVTYTPNPDFSGTDRFTYHLTDGQTSTAAVTLELTVLPVNDPPTATPDQYTVAEDGTLEVSAEAGVLANDNDPDSSGNGSILVQQPVFGVVEMNRDGSFRYTPETDFHGADSFTYATIDDWGARSEATVTVDVDGRPDPPRSRDRYYSVSSHEPGDESPAVLEMDAANGLLSLATDPDGDLLTAELMFGTDHGTLEVNPNGSFTYVPEPGFYGTDAFVFEITDGTLRSEVVTAEIEVVPVDTVPQLADLAYEVNEDQTLVVDAASGLLSTADDADGDPLSIRIARFPVQIAEPDDFEFQPDGSFTYLPRPRFHGVDSVQFFVVDDDGNQSDPVVARIVVHEVFDNPVLADDRLETAEDSSIRIDEHLLHNDELGDLQDAEFAFSKPQNGSLTETPTLRLESLPGPIYGGATPEMYVAGGRLLVSRTPSGASVTEVDTGRERFQIQAISGNWNMIRHTDRELYVNAYTRVPLSSGSAFYAYRTWVYDLETGESRMLYDGVSDSAEWGYRRVTNGQIELIDTANDEVVLRSWSSASSVQHVTFSPDSSKLAFVTTSATGSRTVHLWNLVSSSLIYRDTLHTTSVPVTDLRFSPDGSYVAASKGPEGNQFFGETLVWDTENGHLKLTSTGSGPVFSADESTFATAYHSFSPAVSGVWIWDIAEATVAKHRSVPLRTPSFDPGNRPVRLSADGSTFFTMGVDRDRQNPIGISVAWNAETGEQIVANTADLTVSEDGAWAGLADSAQDKLTLWHLGRREVAATIGGLGQTTEYAFSTDGRWFAAGDESGKVRFWDTASGRLVNEIDTGSGEAVDKILFSTASDLVAIASGNRIHESRLFTGSRVDYTPSDGFLGTDTVEYQLIDAHGTAFGEATVSIDVTPRGVISWDESSGQVTVYGTDQADTMHAAPVRAGETFQITLQHSGTTTRASFPIDDVTEIVFRGYAGNDEITNNTTITSVLRGGDGDDILRGGDGNDELFGGNGEDSLSGNAGDDTLHGGAAGDSYFNQVLEGGAGNDVLFGGPNRDALDGGPGDDQLFGGADRDVLAGGVGTDTLFGEAGRDSYNVTPGSPEAPNRDEIHDDDLQNVVSFRLFTTSVVFSLDGPLEQHIDDATTVVLPNRNYWLLEGSYGDDVLRGRSDGMNEIWGLHGNDLIIGGPAGDALHGGPGNDTLQGGGGVDLLRGESGDDELYGGEGVDRLEGGPGQDIGDGGPGADNVGSDVETDREDPFKLVNVKRWNTRTRAGDKYITIDITGTEYDDHVRISGTSGGILVTMTTDVAGASEAGSSEIQKVIDGIDGAYVALTFDGGAGNDYFEDALAFSDEPFVYGTGMTVYDGAIAYGGVGDDTLVGGRRMDALYGGPGDDVLEGRGGNDILRGGVGNDAYQFGTGQLGADTLYEESEADARDALDFSAMDGPVTVSLTGSRHEARTINPLQLDLVYLPEHFESVIGSDFSDSIEGNSGDNILLGGGGNDTLSGRWGDDLLTGGPGNDELLGNAGFDILSGESGNDTLYGGSGDDGLFGGSGQDHLVGDRGSDKLDSGPDVDTAEIDIEDVILDAELLARQLTGHIKAQIDAVRSAYLDYAEAAYKEVKKSLGSHRDTIRAELAEAEKAMNAEIDKQIDKARWIPVVGPYVVARLEVERSESQDGFATQRAALEQWAERSMSVEPKLRDESITVINDLFGGLEQRAMSLADKDRPSLEAEANQIYMDLEQAANDVEASLEEIYKKRDQPDEDLAPSLSLSEPGWLKWLKERANAAVDYFKDRGEAWARWREKMGKAWVDIRDSFADSLVKLRDDFIRARKADIAAVKSFGDYVFTEIKELREKGGEVWNKWVRDPVVGFFYENLSRDEVLDRLGYSPRQKQIVEQLVYGEGLQGAFAQQLKAVWVSDFAERFHALSDVNKSSAAALADVYTASYDSALHTWLLAHGLSRTGGLAWLDCSDRAIVCSDDIRAQLSQVYKRVVDAQQTVNRAIDQAAAPEANGILLTESEEGTIFSVGIPIGADGPITRLIIGFEKSGDVGNRDYGDRTSAWSEIEDWFEYTSSNSEGESQPEERTVRVSDLLGRQKDIQKQIDKVQAQVSGSFGEHSRQSLQRSVRESATAGIEANHGNNGFNNAVNPLRADLAATLGAEVIQSTADLLLEPKSQLYKNSVKPGSGLGLIRYADVVMQNVVQSALITDHHIQRYQAGNGRDALPATDIIAEFTNAGPTASAEDLNRLNRIRRDLELIRTYVRTLDDNLAAFQALSIARRAPDGPPVSTPWWGGNEEASRFADTQFSKIDAEINEILFEVDLAISLVERMPKR